SLLNNIFNYFFWTYFLYKAMPLYTVVSAMEEKLVSDLPATTSRCHFSFLVRKIWSIYIPVLFFIFICSSINY
ncbi:MAG: hypothetical protein QXN16_03030, partial [Candidatus Micrarchaeaceae archaeon]